MRDDAPVAAERLAELKARYLQAQVNGSRREALRVVIDEGFACGASVSELQQQVIQAAQREIGKLWQENQISVAQEHMATAISQMALAQLYDQAQRAPANGKTILVACVQGELHDFPARLLADALDLAGFDVRYLGADVPISNLIAVVSSQRPDLVALSATMDFNLPALREAVLQLRAAVGEALPIIVGGSACSAAGENLNQELAISANACDTDTVGTINRLLGLLS